MNSWFWPPALSFLLAISLFAGAANSASQQTRKTDDILLSAMTGELQRARDQLGKLDPPVYFTSYSARDQVQAVAYASQGSLVNSTRTPSGPATMIWVGLGEVNCRPAAFTLATMPSKSFTLKPR